MAVLQRAFSDLENSLDDDRQHGGLEPEKQCLYRSDFAVSGIEPAQHHQADIARQDEQSARDQPAGYPMQQPADVDGKLLGLWPR